MSAVLEIDDAGHCRNVCLDFAGDGPGTDVPEDQRGTSVVTA